jgi:hypothetical protein
MRYDALPTGRLWGSGSGQGSGSGSTSIGSGASTSTDTAALDQLLMFPDMTIADLSAAMQAVMAAAERQAKRRH